MAGQSSGPGSGRRFMAVRAHCDSGRIRPGIGQPSSYSIVSAVISQLSPLLVVPLFYGKPSTRVRRDPGGVRFMPESSIMTALMGVIQERKAHAPDQPSYVVTLFSGGVARIGAKIMEEAA